MSTYNGLPTFSDIRETTNIGDHDMADDIFHVDRKNIIIDKPLYMANNLSYSNETKSLKSAQEIVKSGAINKPADNMHYTESFRLDITKTISVINGKCVAEITLTIDGKTIKRNIHDIMLINDISRDNIAHLILG